MNCELLFVADTVLERALLHLANRFAKVTDLRTPDGGVYLQWKSEDAACAADILVALRGELKLIRKASTELIAKSQKLKAKSSRRRRP